MQTENRVDLDAIILKIQKLQALAEEGRGATEAEINTAMAHIKRLLAEHNLSMSDIALKATPKANVIEGGVPSDDDYYNRLSEERLHFVVCNLTNTKHFYRRYHGAGRNVIFIGYKADVEIAKALLTSLREVVKAMAINYWKENGKSVSKRAYKVGLVMRMLERSKEKVDMGKDNEKYGALIVVKDGAITDYLNGLGLGKAKKVRKSALNHDDMARGYKDGDKVDMGFKDRIGENK